METNFEAIKLFFLWINLAFVELIEPGGQNAIDIHTVIRMRDMTIRFFEDGTYLFIDSAGIQLGNPMPTSDVIPIIRDANVIVDAKVDAKVAEIVADKDATIADLTSQIEVLSAPKGDELKGTEGVTNPDGK